MDTYSTAKAVFNRFLRGAIAGAAASMAVMNVSGVNTFNDLGVFLTSLSVAGIMGGVTGGILALDKYFRA